MNSDSQPNSLESLKLRVRANDPSSAAGVRSLTAERLSFSEVLGLSAMRNRLHATGLWPVNTRSLKIGVIGGCSLSPIVDLLQHFVECSGINAEIWSGDYDNYVSEALDPGSALYELQPDVVIVIPSERTCSYPGSLSDPFTQQEKAAEDLARNTLQLCEAIHQKCGAEVVLTNFRLTPHFDPGPLRYRSAGSDYAFRKLVNQAIGVAAPDFLHICDVEFLANRYGTLTAFEERTWFESKQPYAFDFMVEVARDMAHICTTLRMPAKKVLVLDLDNTLWGGVVGDDGLEGIEIGTTSPSGEAFRAFQQYVKSLTERGVLLAVCSKNDLEKAVEPFERHPEMVLRLDDFVSFKANWEPKSENIRQMSTELSLGLDSFVFVDDNPAEIEIVRQFLPDVVAIHLGDDPSLFVRLLKDSRCFEVGAITAEDIARVSQYKQEANRQALLSTATDMDAYLSSLDMNAEITAFRPVDVPRITQLINKSNQFNLTTRRRTESEVRAILDSGQPAFTVRLGDRFGDHGLIAVVVLEMQGEIAMVDTWLMSCRVLKRQVEELTLNEIVRLAVLHGAKRLVGKYLPTKKNGLVRELYPRLGFECLAQSEEAAEFTLALTGFEPSETHIKIKERAFATAGDL